MLIGTSPENLNQILQTKTITRLSFWGLKDYELSKDVVEIPPVQHLKKFKCTYARLNWRSLLNLTQSRGLKELDFKKTMCSPEFEMVFLEISLLPELKSISCVQITYDEVKTLQMNNLVLSMITQYSISEKMTKLRTLIEHNNTIRYTTLFHILLSQSENNFENEKTLTV